MAGFDNSRAIATALLMPTTAAPDPIFGPIGSIFINNNRFLHAYGTQNTFLGQNAGNFTLTTATALGNLGIGTASLSSLTTGGANTCVGDSSGSAITSGNNNTAFGIATLEILTTGVQNTAVGSGALELATTANFNTAVGSGALSNITTATSNTALGINAGTNYTTENSNLVLGNTGIVGDANWIRIGQQGAGLAQQNKCNIAGIYGITPASATIARVIIDDTGQLGTQVGGGTSIETITGNDGVPRSPLLGNFNLLTANATVLFIGSAATETLDFARTSNPILGSNAAGITTATNNVGLGVGALAALTTGQSNVAVGNSALTNLTSSIANTAVGFEALTTISTTVSGSTAVGFQALKFSTTGLLNTAIGAGSGRAITTGSGNTLIGELSASNMTNALDIVAIGRTAGSAYVLNEARNIVVGPQVPGIAGESDVIRVGQSNTSGIQLTDMSRRFLHNFGTLGGNIFLGIDAGNFTTGSGANIGIGTEALQVIGNGNSNVAIGDQVAGALTTGNQNVLLGFGTGNNLISGANNTAIGTGSLIGLTTGSYNLVLGGLNSGNNLTLGDSSNIFLQNTGQAGDNNTIRIGTQGAGFAQQNRAFIAGVYGVTPALAPELVVIDSNGQLGSAGGGIPTATVIVTVSQALSPNTQYIIQAGAPVSLSLPATSLVGDVIRIVGDSNLWTITQGAGQQISFAGTDSTLGVGGSVAALAGSDCAELICVATDTRWTIFTSVGNLNVI